MSTRRTRWNRIVTLIVAGGLAAGLTACSSSEEDGLLVYNAQHESLTKEWIDAFTKETGIKVTYRQGGDTELGNQLIAEGDASPADVFLTENSPAMAAVERDGLFTDVDEATIAQVPPQFRPATSKWTGVAARTTVFAYDKTKLTEAQLPTSIMDLEKPEWKGRWGAPPVKPDFQAIVAAMLELTGERATGQWLAGMKAGAEIYSDNIATLRAVNDGQVEGGIIYHYYWFRDQSQTKEISGNTALHYFRNQDPGAFVSIELEGREVERVIVVPRAAVHQGRHVWVVDDDERLEQRSFEVLWGSDEELFVSSSELREGDRVVTSPLTSPIEGTRVRVTVQQDRTEDGDDR